jgi:hypothetical protein
MDRAVQLWAVIAVFTACALVTGCANGVEHEVAADAAERMIDARADTHLERMGAFLARQPALTFAADVLYEDYLVGATKYQITRTTTVEFCRPNLVRAQAKSDTESRRYWFDGRQVSILDETANVYARLDVPGTYDQMLAVMNEKYGMSMSLGELLLSDPYGDLLHDAREGSYVGVRTVGGYRCHQLVVSHDTLDWQIWIDAGEQPWPRKLVVTYKNLPACPQFSATFTRWDTAASTQAGDYAFVPPTNAVEVEEIEPLPSAGSRKSK